jgi:hypothetical protein
MMFVVIIKEEHLHITEVFHHDAKVVERYLTKMMKNGVKAENVMVMNGEFMKVSMGKTAKISWE